MNSFQGGAGDDFFDGRGANDTVVYNPLRANDVTGSVTINLAAGTVTGNASVGTDTLRSIEGARGSIFDDIYDASNFGAVGFLDPLINNVGSGGTFNSFEGDAGNDTVIGNGNTRVAYDRALAAVTVDLAAPGVLPGSTGTASGTAPGDLAGIGVDTFFGGVIQAGGSTFDDHLYGSSASDTLLGLAGDDYMDGRSGNFDHALYGTDPDLTGPITVDMAAGIVTGDASIGTDTLRSISPLRAPTSTTHTWRPALVWSAP